MAGKDDRLLVIIGPCSIHDPAAAVEYARRLKVQRDKYKDTLEIVMRVYFEKPRTTVGWKGLINDPGMDNTFDVERGLRTARSLLLDIIDLGLPVGCEFLEPTSTQYIADAVAAAGLGSVDKRLIELVAPIKGLGSHEAILKLRDGIVATITVSVVAAK